MQPRRCSHPSCCWGLPWQASEGATRGRSPCLLIPTPCPTSPTPSHHPPATPPPSHPGSPPTHPLYARTPKHEERFPSPPPHCTPRTPHPPSLPLRADTTRCCRGKWARAAGRGVEERAPVRAAARCCWLCCCSCIPALPAFDSMACVCVCGCVGVRVCARVVSLRCGKKWE